MSAPHSRGKSGVRRDLVDTALRRHQVHRSVPVAFAPQVQPLVVGHADGGSTATGEILVVMTHRPGGSAALADVRELLLTRARADALDLEPLSRPDVSTVVRRHSPGNDQPMIESIWHASGGVPFFVVEMARSASDGVAISAKQLLLSALPPATAGSLGSAAVLGKTFDTDEFVAVSGLSDEQSYVVLDISESQRLRRRTSTAYEFRHALVRDTVLDGLIGSDRRALHRLAADALMDLDASPAGIGHHLMEAGKRGAAVPWLMKTGETSAALGAYLDALETLACADAGPVDAYRETVAVAPDRAWKMRLRNRLARVARFAGDLETAAVALDGLEPAEAAATEVRTSRTGCTR